MGSDGMMLTGAVIFMSLLLGAFRFMRFIRSLTGSDHKAKMRQLYPESHLSFDERVAERMRELERERR
jgi:hypothetical protein